MSDTTLMRAKKIENNAVCILGRKPFHKRRVLDVGLWHAWFEGRLASSQALCVVSGYVFGATEDPGEVGEFAVSVVGFRTNIDTHRTPSEA